MSFDHSTEHEIRTRLVEVGLEKGEISELMSGVPSYGGPTEVAEPDPDAIDREAARRLYEAKRFDEAYSAFSALGSLTELERRKMEYARKRSVRSRAP